MLATSLKAGIISSGLFLTYSYYGKDKIQLEASEEKKQKIIRYQPFNTGVDSKYSTMKPKFVQIKREPRTFFEKPVLEAMSKIAIYHLVGFIGYLPFISDYAHYLVIPSLPFNLFADGVLFYSLWNKEKNVNLFGKSYTTKEYTKYVDYCSWIFGFISAGGTAKALGPLLGMLASMYIYTLIRKNKYNKYEAILTGTLGASVAQTLIMTIAPFYFGRMKKLPFGLGFLASYAALSSFICYLIDVYIEGKNDEKLPSTILSTYKWTYLNMFLLTSMTAEQE